MTRYATVSVITGGWLIVTATIVRLIIPALINSHNDGAIILAILFGFGTATPALALCAAALRAIAAGMEP